MSVAARAKDNASGVSIDSCSMDVDANGSGNGNGRYDGIAADESRCARQAAEKCEGGIQYQVVWPAI